MNTPKETSCMLKTSNSTILVKFFLLMMGSPETVLELKACHTFNQQEIKAPIICLLPFITSYVTDFIHVTIALATKETAHYTQNWLHGNITPLNKGEKYYLKVSCGAYYLNEERLSKFFLACKSWGGPTCDTDPALWWDDSPLCVSNHLVHSRILWGWFVDDQEVFLTHLLIDWPSSLGYHNAIAIPCHL